MKILILISNLHDDCFYTCYSIFLLCNSICYYYLNRNDLVADFVFALTFMR